MKNVEYNSERPKLIIPEYGRNIQKMVEFACTVKDKDERNKVAQAIINVMGQLHPHLRDVTEFNHKLWDQLHIMADYELDVDSPFPKPDKEVKKKRPEKLSYPADDIRYKHYGKTIELMIEKAVEMPDGEEKEALTELIANLMKKSYLNWNRDSVNDKVIYEHLDKLSKGKLKLKDDFSLDHTNEILSRTKRKKKPSRGQHSNRGRNKGSRRK